MDDAAAMSLAALVLAAGSAVVDGIDTGVRARGFAGLRPAHGFAFVRLSGGGATVSELAEHLGVTRQAAGQLVDELAGAGYVRKLPHPDDARARLIVLTDRGVACTAAAQAAAGDVIRDWAGRIGAARVAELAAELARVAPPGRLRPTW